MVAIRTPRRTDDGFYVSRVTWTCDARVQIETFEPNAASSFEVAGAGIQLHNLEGDFYVNGCRLLFGEAIEVGKRWRGFVDPVQMISLTCTVDFLTKG